MTLPTARLTLVTRVNCHLCDVAKQALARVAEASGEGWHELDVDADPVLFAEYSERVPVVLLDGREHSQFRVDEARLLRDLRASASPPTP